MLKIRLMGAQREVLNHLELLKLQELRKEIKILKVSDIYENKTRKYGRENGWVRLYVEVEVLTPYSRKQSDYHRND